MQTDLNKRFSKRLHPLFSVGLLLIAIACLGWMSLHFWDWYTYSQGTARPPLPRHTVTTSAVIPDEKPVPADAEYSVAADQPRKILIPSIDVDGFIQRVGKTKSGDIAAPSNVHYAGWYIQSVKPGEPGLSIIDGHVSGRYSTAIFAKLNNLQKNATFSVEFGDGSMRHFQVIDKRELPVSETSKFLLTKRDDIENQLNLVTCGGDFDKKSSTFRNRIVIVAKNTD